MKSIPDLNMDAFHSVSTDLAPLSFTDMDSSNKSKPQTNALVFPKLKYKEIGNFPCPNCKSTYNRHDNLVQHLKYVCNQKPRFACPYCKYVTKRTFSVYGHVRTKHPGKRVGFVDVENPSKFFEPQNNLLSG